MKLTPNQKSAANKALSIFADILLVGFALFFIVGDREASKTQEYYKNRKR